MYKRQVFDELHKPVGLGVFRTVARYAGKDRFCMATKYGKFRQEGGIVRDIGIFLIGEYPFVFTGTYAGSRRISTVRRATASNP